MRTHSRSRLNFLTPPQISDHKKLPTLGSNEREEQKVINKMDKWDQVKASETEAFKKIFKAENSF